MAEYPWQTHAAHNHHAELWSDLTQHEAALIRALEERLDFEEPRRALVEFLRSEALPHLHSEEEVLYSATRGAGAGALVATLELDHEAMLSAVHHIEQATSALDAAMAGRVFVTLFALRMQKEETVLLPALAEAGVDPAILLEGRPALVGPADLVAAVSAGEDGR